MVKGEVIDYSTRFIGSRSHYAIEWDGGPIGEEKSLQARARLPVDLVRNARNLRDLLGEAGVPIRVVDLNDKRGKTQKRNRANYSSLLKYLDRMVGLEDSELRVPSEGAERVLEVLMDQTD